MFETEPFNEEIIGLKTATAGPDGNPIMWVYAYLINDTLIDTGCGNGKEELRDYIKGRTIKNIYISHAHEDHFGSADLFAHEADIFAWKSGIDLVRNPIEIGEFFQYVWGQPQPIDEVKPLPSTFEIGTYRFEVVEVPGHN